jgi:hypothetical protein
MSKKIKQVDFKEFKMISGLNNIIKQNKLERAINKMRGEVKCEGYQPRCKRCIHKEYHKARAYCDGHYCWNSSRGELKCK